MPGEAKPCVIEVRLRGHVSALEVDDRQRRLRKPVVGDDEVLAVGRFHHGERQVANRQVSPGRLDLPAVGKQGHAVSDVAWPGGRSRRESRDADDGGGDEDHAGEGDGGEVSIAHKGRFYRTKKKGLMEFPQHQALEISPAATYSPTESPLQYHWR